MGFNGDSSNNINMFEENGIYACNPPQQDNNTQNFSGSIGNYTYGAILINEQAYKANIEIKSNGTINSTSVIINGEHFKDKFDINASNYKSKLTKNELQKEIQALIGTGNGSIAVGQVGQQKLSLTTFDLPAGNYYLFVGAYDPKGKIAGLTQLDLEITSGNNNNNNNDNNNNNNNNNNKNNNNGNTNNNNNNGDTSNINNNGNTNNDISGNGGSGGGSGSGDSGSGGSSGNSGSQGRVGSHDSANNTTSSQVPSDVAPQNGKGTKTETGGNSQKGKNGGISQIASFFIGLLVILLAGALILKTIRTKQGK